MRRAGCDGLLWCGQAFFRRGAALLALALAVAPGVANAVDREDVAPPPKWMDLPEPKEDNPPAEDVTATLAERVLRVPGISDQKFRVAFKDGVVTLSGYVETLEARRRTVQESRRVRGVRAVVDRLILVAPERPDHELAPDVARALHEDELTHDLKLVTSVEKSVATIKGEVENFAAAELVRRAVAAVPGIRAIDDKLTITYDEPRSRSDEDIRKDITRRIKADEFFSEAPVAVDVNGGKVSLSGRLESEREKTLIRNHCWVAGVVDLTDEELTVDETLQHTMLKGRDDFRRSDRQLRANITQVFASDPRVGTVLPELEVRNGRVQIMGVVTSDIARRAIADDVRNVVGVYNVRDVMEVRPTDIATDAEVQVRSEEILAHHPVLGARELEVAVYNGRARILGSVINESERKMVARIIKKVRGVRSVDNQTTIAPTSARRGGNVTPVLPPE